jgi:hypothetical protein
MGNDKRKKNGRKKNSRRQNTQSKMLFKRQIIWGSALGFTTKTAELMITEVCLSPFY